MTRLDYAIFGSNLLSSLLAGLLARDHGKAVARIGRRPSAQRLPRAIELALPMSIRPRSWQMVREGEREVGALVASLGVPEATNTREVLLSADAAGSAQALDHVAHLAVGFGHQVRRAGQGWAIRRVGRLHADELEEKLTAWLTGLGVVLADEGPVEAGRSVLADDVAVLDQLAPDTRPSILQSETMTATLIAAPRELAVAVTRYVDRGVTLVARPGNTVLALISGEHDVEVRLASTLDGPFPMKRLATTRYRRIVSADGASVLGDVAGAFVVAGLGTFGPWLAPALARHLAGKASADDAGWFAMHDASAARDAVADFVEARF